MFYEPVVGHARIGFIIPSSNRMVEPQAQRHLPPGYVPHFTRIGMTGRHKAPLERLLPRILDAAELLADSKCDLTVLQCTGTSMSGGVEMEAQVIAEIERKTGKPAISAASAVMAALRTVAAKKIVFISETKQDDHDRKKLFLAEAGYELLADTAAGLAGTDAYCSTPPQFWIDLALSMRNDDADAYFISCANIHSIDTIPTLERALQRPVITSNQASFWLSLRMVGLTELPSSLGELGRRSPAAAVGAPREDQLPFIPLNGAALSTRAGGVE